MLRQGGASTNRQTFYPEYGQGAYNTPYGPQPILPLAPYQPRRYRPANRQPPMEYYPQEPPIYPSAAQGNPPSSPQSSSPPRGPLHNGPSGGPQEQKPGEEWVRGPDGAFYPPGFDFAAQRSAQRRARGPNSSGNQIFITF
jgi:hypothetical protein